MTDTSPKLFISYSWSSPDYQQQVIELATKLRGDGVDVILDKWDLREGDDAVAFMEKMVTDPDVKKVAMLCDRMYAAKADGRDGGVGTETQIISEEVYKKTQQSKFVAVVMERDVDGKPCLPTYCKPRIHIDLTDASRYSENYERLLRWICDKPEYLKPEIGTMPSYLTEPGVIGLATSGKHQRVMEALRNGRPYTAGALEEYFEAFASGLGAFGISGQDDDFDQQVVDSITAFLPHRDQVIDVFQTIARYGDASLLPCCTRFFEQLMPYMYRCRDVSSHHDCDIDNYRFIVHELFLHAISAMIKRERYEFVNALLQHHYYVDQLRRLGCEPPVHFSWFYRHVESLDHRNRRLKMDRVSLRADMLRERCGPTVADFKWLMQADFVLFLRNCIERLRGGERPWYPVTLLYSTREPGAFEIFARSRSKAHFDRAKSVLGIQDKGELESVIQALRSSPSIVPTFDYHPLPWYSLLGYDQLATQP